MALCHVTGTVYLPDGSVAARRNVEFYKLPDTVTADYLGAVVPEVITVRTSADGDVDVNLITGNYYGFVLSRNGKEKHRFTAIVPESAAADLADLIAAVDPVEPLPAWLQQAFEARDDAEAAVTLAEGGADRAETAATALANATSQNQQSLVLSDGQLLLDEDADGNPIIVGGGICEIEIDGKAITPGTDFEINPDGHPVLLREFDAGKIVYVTTIPNFVSPTATVTASAPSAALRSFAAEPYDSVADVLASKQITAALTGQTIHTKDGHALLVVSSGGAATAGGAGVIPATNKWTPEDFGAKGDGVADDSAAFALMALAQIGGENISALGQYRLQSLVVFTKPAKWDFGGTGSLLNACASAGVAVSFSGSQLTSEQTLASDVPSGFAAFDVPNASGVLPGDLIYIRGDKVLEDSRPEVNYEAEWAVVASVSGNSVTLADPRIHSYATADNARVTFFRPITGLQFNNLRASNVLDREGDIAVLVQYFTDLTVNGTEQSLGEKGLYARFGVGSKVYDPKVVNVNKGLGYAIQHQAVRYADVYRPTGYGCRHAVEFSSNCLFANVHSPSLQPGTAAVISYHPGPLYCGVYGGFVGGGVFMRGSFNTVEGLTIGPGAMLSFGEVEEGAPATKMIAGVNTIVRRNTFIGGGGAIAKVHWRHPPRNVLIEGNSGSIGGALYSFGSPGNGISIVNDTVSTTGVYLTLYKAPTSVTSFGDACFKNVRIDGVRGISVGRLLATTANSLLTSGALLEGFSILNSDITVNNVDAFNMAGQDVGFIGFAAKNTRFRGPVQRFYGTLSSAPLEGFDVENIKFDTGTNYESGTVLTQTTGGNAGIARVDVRISTRERTNPDGRRAEYILECPEGYVASYRSVTQVSGFITAVNYKVQSVTDGSDAPDGVEVRFKRIR